MTAAEPGVGGGQAGELAARVRLLAACRALRARREQRRPESPAELARRVDPTFRVTPAIRLLSDIARRAVERGDCREIVSTPPRTGKSTTLAIAAPAWALSRNPDMRIVIATYSDELAQAHSREVRRLITEHGDLLGIKLAPDKTAVGRWLVDGRRGGMLATGINSGVTGFGADLMLVDDPVKDAAEADSRAHRRRVLNEFQSTLSTRLHPGGSIIVVMTRWHEEDLAGELLRREPDRWRRTNIPAVSEPGVEDALCRDRPGVAMVSALGYTLDDFRALRRTVGERAWYALYMGEPRTPAGGLVQKAWLDAWRLEPAEAARAVYTVVAVDPSDSGQGDACGLVAMSLLPGGRVVAVVADRSRPMTSDEWAREAVDLAVRVGASEIAVEAFAARETYTRVVREAVERARVAGRLDRVLRVSGWPPRGRARVGDAVARSSALLQGLETGTCRLAGVFPELEARAVGWQAGQHQPDVLAAMVVGFDVLSQVAGRGWSVSVPSGSLDGSVGSGGDVVALDWMRQRVG